MELHNRPQGHNDPVCEQKVKKMFSTHNFCNTFLTPV